MREELPSTPTEHIIAIVPAAICISLAAWPTLTLEWFPEKGYDADTECHVHQLLLGTNTSGQELNYLMNTHVLLPSHPVCDTHTFVDHV